MIEEYTGSSDSGPTFPRKGERWFECWICGFNYVISERRLHYRSQREVCCYCDDKPSHRDYLAEMEVPSQAEALRREPAEQTATCQGEVIGSRWYQADFYRGKWYDAADPDCSGDALAPKGK